MAQPQPDKPSWHVRIRRTRGGEPEGAGVACSSSRVITCAHVLSDDDESPAGNVFVDFPPYEYAPAMVPAKVVAWFPPGPDPADDVAVLELALPPGLAVESAPFSGSESAAHHPFSARGFPAGHDGSVLVTGVVVGGGAAGWVQLQAAEGGFPVEGGFSGAPIWDETQGAVIGLITAKDLARGNRTGYGITVEALRRRELLPEPRVIVYLEIRNPDGGTVRNYPLLTDRERRTPTTIGSRAPGYLVPDIVLEVDPGSWVSRGEHCRLEFDERRWRLTDAGSRNGTFVRRRGTGSLERVADAAGLQSGDVICIRAAAAGTGFRYWELEFHDPHQTPVIRDQSAPPRPGVGGPEG